MVSIRLVTAGLTGLLLAAVWAAPGQAQPVALEGARVFDGQRDLGEATVLIEGSRIVAVGPTATLQVPDDARRIDLSGHVLIPGLIANHSHVGNTQGVDHGRRHYTQDNVLAELRQFQAYGVTSVVALGLNPPEPFFAVRDAIRSGRAQGADFFGAGRGLGVPDGAPPADRMQLADDQVARAGEPEAGREAIQAMATPPRVDIVKLWVDDMGGSVPIMPEPVFGAAIAEAQAHGLRVAAHIHDLEPARALVQANVDIIAHGVRDTPVDAEFIAALRDNGTWYIPTVQIDEAEYIYAEHPEWLEDAFFRNAIPDAMAERIADAEWRGEQLSDSAESRERVATNLANLRTLHAAGARIGFGTDSGALPHRVIGFAEHRELELMVEAGLTPTQALSVATANAAELMQWTDRGRIAAGLRADLVVLEGNPLEDIRHTRRIAAVWQGGEQVAGPVVEFTRGRGEVGAP